MPRQQVYGKRSRAIFDATAIFAANSSSPSAKSEDQNQARNGSVPSLSHPNEETTLTSVGAKSKPRVRKALREINANGVATDTIPSAKKGRRREVRTVEVRIGQRNRPLDKRIPTSDVPGRESEPQSQAGQVIERNGLKEQCTSKGTLHFVVHNEPESQAEEPLEIFQKPRVSKTDPTGLGRTLVPATATPLAPMDSTDIYTTHTASLLSLSAHGLTAFSEWSNQLASHFSLVRIAEASFGEVYRLSVLPDALLPGFSRADESVFKIIALQTPTSTLPKDKRKRTAALRKQEAMSKVGDVANEVRLLQRMSTIPGFTNFRDVRVVRGRPPPAFISAFNAFNTAQKAKGREMSVFPDPAKKSSYDETQLWAVIEMQDAGTDLERCVDEGEFTSIWAIWDVFWQVVLTLGKGEEGAEFEHRDLHLGNICVRPSTALPSINNSDKPNIDITRNLKFCNLETTIIDYTLSRALMPRPSSSEPKTPDIAFHDLAHTSNTALFEADSTNEYQYEIYRYMRNAVSRSHNLQPCHHPPTSPPTQDNPWRAFTPLTNLVWLHFILHKLLEQPGICWPSMTPRPSRKSSPSEYRKWKRSNVLETRLRAVQGLLDPQVLGAESELQGARDLVALAFAEGWMSIGDVVGEDVGGLELGGGHGQEGLIEGEESEALLVQELQRLRIARESEVETGNGDVKVPRPSRNSRRKKARE